MSIVWQSESRVPTLVSGLGVLFIVVFLLEVVTASLYPVMLPDGYLIGVLSSFVFIGGLLYGSHWLAASGLSTDRFRRIGLWCLGGGLAITPLVIWLAVESLPGTVVSAHLIVGTVRWAGSIGSASGLALGIFEAQAIERRRVIEQLETRTDALRRERDRLERFADIVSHDLQNPLHVIDGRLALARRDHDSEHLEEIAAAHDRMTAIVEDTLTLAREGKAVDATEPVDLTEICDHAWAVVETQRADLDIETGMGVAADGDRLRHVFENLFRNSVDHGVTENEGELTIRVGPLADRSGFYIEDTGSGIPEADRSTVFDNGYTTSTDGTGLGLAIVNDIITAHGWTVAVGESAEGGARFEIRGVDSLQVREQSQLKQATAND
jgi:signal transduction histidine kinase